MERAHPLTPLVRAWILLVGFVFVFGREIIERGNNWPSWDEVQHSLSSHAFMAALIAGGIVLLTLGAGFWSWWTNKFVISPTELRIENTGAFSHSKRIAYQRIQSVDVVQPFAARLLGLAQLSIDAGSEGPTKIQYLKRSRAVAMRDELLRRAHGLAPDAPAAATASAWTDTSATDRVLITVPPQELLLGAVLSHELLLLVAAAAIPLIVGAVLHEPMLIGGGIIPILLAIWGFVSKRVMGQWNYTLADTGAGLRLTRGLTTLSSETLPVSRVQAIRIHEPVLWRRIGRARVDLSLLNTQAITTNEDGSGASSIMLPIGNRWAVSTALNAVWPGLNLDAVPLDPAPRAARWLAPLGWRWIAHGADDQVAVLRRGWWTRTTWVIPHARLQSAVAAQGPLRRRLGVASVALHTSGSAMGSPTTYLDAPGARAFVFDEMRRARIARSADALTQTPALPLGSGLPTDSDSQKGT